MSSDELLTKILEEMGPCLSGEIVRVLVTEHGMTPSAARQRIARRPAAITTLYALSFSKNQQFLYLQKDYGAPHFWPALAKALETSSPGYSGAIGALAVRGGLMPVAHFMIACGAPFNLTRHPAPEEVLKQLVAANVLEELEVEGIGKCIGFARKGQLYVEEAVANMRTRLLLEEIMLRAVRDWARRLAIGSYKRFQLRDEDGIPQVGSFPWDLTAPSFLSGLVGGPSKSGKPKPGFVVCDVLLGHQQTEAGLRPFLRKCQTLRSLKNVGRCLTIFLAQGYTEKAFNAARSQGILPATPETLFGKELAEAFIDLANVLTQAATVASVDPVTFDKLFRQLGKIEGAAQSLRGVLFEFVVADLIRKLWGAEVTLNRKFRELGQDAAEVDVVAVLTGRSIHFIECKGQEPHNTVDDAEVEKWLTKRIPLVRKKALEHPDWKNLDMYFELWTSGRLSDGAAARISEMQATVSKTKYQLVHRNGDDISKLANQLNDETLKRVLKTHFLEHPLAADDLLKLDIAVPSETSLLPLPDLPTEGPSDLPRLPKAS